jgi:hypothetical protein
VQNKRDLALVLLPGLDGSGLLFSPLLEKLEPIISTLVIKSIHREKI